MLFILLATAPPGSRKALGRLSAEQQRLVSQRLVELDLVRCACTRVRTRGFHDQVEGHELRYNHLATERHLTFKDSPQGRMRRCRSDKLGGRGDQKSSDAE